MNEISTERFEGILRIRFNQPEKEDAREAVPALYEKRRSGVHED
jgi:hypothetical protein